MKELYNNPKRLIIFAISILVSTINFNLLLKPISLVCGGSGGLALVIEKIVNISTSHTIAIIYVITVILSMLLLEKKTMASIIIASILYPSFIYLTENITSVIHLNYSDVLLISIISGIISGITNGIAYKYGYSPGGLGVLPPIFHKYFKVSVGVGNFVVNGIVVLMGAYFFGFNMVVYAIILLYISSYVCNLVILGLSNDKVMFIHSNKNDIITKILHDKYKINVTIIDDETDNKTLLAVIKNIDYNAIKTDLKKIDRKVFFTTNNCYEVGK